MSKLRDITGSRQWQGQQDRADREEIREYHRLFWDHLKRTYGFSPSEQNRYLPRFRESIAALLDQDYGLEDIAVMFGLTRERMGQIALQLGLRQRDGSTQRGSSFRLFDWDRGRFVSVDAEEFQRVRVKAQREVRVDALRAALRRFVAKRGRVPSLTELGREVFPSYESSDLKVMAVFGYYSKPGKSAIALSRLDAMYAEEGYRRPGRLGPRRLRRGAAA